MLFSLLIQVSHDLWGLSPATLFQQVTGVSGMTFRRGRGYAALMGPNRDEILRHRDAWLMETSMSRGATADEAAEELANLPDGIAAQVVYGLGLLGESCSPALRQLVRSLDDADVRACRLADKDDIEGFIRELGPSCLLGSDYSAPLEASGIKCLAEGAGPAEAHLWEIAMTRRAHMALSLLAAIDIEMSRWNERVFRADPCARVLKLGLDCSRCCSTDHPPSSGLRRRAHGHCRDPW